MMAGEMQLVGAYVVAGGILLTLISILVMVTIGFPYTRLIEERAATAKALAGMVSYPGAVDIRSPGHCSARRRICPTLLNKRF